MMENKHQTNYYLVTAMCGHVGKKKYVPINFAVAAANPMEAMELTRRIPRVKHDRRNAILNIQPITYEAYLLQRKANREDPYLQARTEDAIKAIPGIKKRIREYEERPNRTGQSKRRAFWKREGRYLEEQQGRKGKFAW